ncbi:lipocalin family protein [Jannaschia sp. KMU-145]|uniref:lipocalin family protein n=1 Tax=Jannaschia halovivens TaxID=3388667 RepID=UPI00396B1662
MIRALALALTLTGCAAAVAPLLPSYRDTTVAIASKADFDPARFAGLWHEVARFPVAFQSDCPRATAEYAAPTGDRLRLRNTCRTPDGTAIRAITGDATVIGPGRLRVELSGVPFAAPLWVLWTDADYRTAVLGQPNGRAGWILNRDPAIPEDRLRSALTVLDFNGYDTTQLRYAPPNRLR